MLRFWSKLALAALAFLLGVCLFVAWRAMRRDRAQLQAQLVSAQQALQAANARQQSRDAELAQQLAALQRQQNAIHTPAQALHALPQVLPLPTPLVAANEAVPGQPLPPRPDVSANSAPTPPAGQSSDKPDSPTPQVQIPTEDLKPLYDFALACKACQAQLTTAQADLKDEQAKTRALTTERDAALRAVRGGSPFRRVARAAKWFVIGAAAGALAAKFSH